MPYPNYIVKVDVIPQTSNPPTTTSGGAGQIVIVGPAAAPDVTLQLQPNTSFFLMGVDGGGAAESPGILRSCITAAFNSATRENTFTFSPAPATVWAARAYVAVWRSSSTANPYPGYSALSSTSQPDATLITNAVTDNIQNNPAFR